MNELPPYTGKIIDAHAHVMQDGIQGLFCMAGIQKKYGYAASNLLSVECMDDAAQNALMIYSKLLFPNQYAFGGFHYRFPYSFLEEAQRLSDIGLDGIKMVENKPSIRLKLNMPSNDSRYDGFYRWAAETKLPLLVHVADPEEFWDKDTIPDFAKAAGYYYGEGGYIEKEQIYAELFDVLERFQGLNITMAHFFFLSGSLERLAGLLERHPAMKVDVTAGTEMYFNFSKDCKATKDFFMRWQDRILFGTDNVDSTEQADIETADVINHFEHAFLQMDGEIPAWDKKIVGIGLPFSVLEKIYYKNFLAFAGRTPKKICTEAASAYLKERLSDQRYRLSDRERQIISTVWEFIQKIGAGYEKQDID